MFLFVCHVGIECVCSLLFAKALEFVLVDGLSVNFFKTQIIGAHLSWRNCDQKLSELCTLSLEFRWWIN